MRLDRMLPHQSDVTTGLLMYMLRMLPQSRVWWMGHRALRALVLL